MGKRGHRGKKRNKENKPVNEIKENQTANESKINNQLADEVKQDVAQEGCYKNILDKKYRGPLRSVKILDICPDIFPIKELKEYIQLEKGDNYQLYAIENLQRRRLTPLSGAVFYAPSLTIKLTFKGTEAPSKLKVWGMERECIPYYNSVIQCFKCLRFRHLSTTCKGYARCSKCGTRKDASHECVGEELKCVNCHGNHDAFDKTCPQRSYHQQINELRAGENIDYKTAVQKLKMLKNAPKCTKRGSCIDEDCEEVNTVLKVTDKFKGLLAEEPQKGEKSILEKLEYIGAPALESEQETILAKLNDLEKKLANMEKHFSKVESNLNWLS